MGEIRFYAQFTSFGRTFCISTFDAIISGASVVITELREVLGNECCGKSLDSVKAKNYSGAILNHRLFLQKYAGIKRPVPISSSPIFIKNGKIV